VTVEHHLIPIVVVITDTGYQTADIFCSCGWTGYTSEAYRGDNLQRKARNNHKQHVHRMKSKEASC